MTTTTGNTVTKQRVQTFLTPLEIARLKKLSSAMQISQSEFLSRAFRDFADAQEARMKAEGLSDR